MYGLDLFSGIGGITEALESYVQPVAYCENDRYAQAVLMSRMRKGEIPYAPIWDDVRTLRGSMCPPVDIIYGGFPCQDISVAGRREGLEGKRSGLFFEIARLVSEIRPRFVFLENVSAITIRGAERVVGEFCRLRYDCRWGILSASDVGANHQRERWWLLAHANDNGSLEDSRRSLRPGSQFPETDGVETEKQNADQFERSSALADANGGAVEGAEKWQPKRPEQNTSRKPENMADTRSITPQRTEQQDGKGRRAGMGRGEVSNTSSERLERWTKSETPWTTRRESASRNQPTNWWQPEPNVGRVAHGIPFRSHRLRALGNSVVPAQAREAFERLMGLNRP